MNNLELFSKLKRRNHSLLTEPQERLYKNASEIRRISPFSKRVRVNQLSNAEYSKVLPKNMLYDKESLYLEVLALKVELNQIMDENIRLKTRIVTLERDLQVMNRKNVMEESDSPFRGLKSKNEGVRISESPLIEGLKKMLKQTKKQTELLKNQNGKMKKSLKLSKLNELEVQNTIILQENRKLSLANEELQHKVELSQAVQQKNQQLERSKSALAGEIKRLENEMVTMHSYVQAVQLDQKYEVSSLNVREKRRPGEFTFDRRKNLRAVQNLQELKKQFISNKEASFRINKKSQKLLKIHQNILPIRREPISSTLLKQLAKQTEKRSQDDLFVSRNQQLEKENDKLKRQNESLEVSLKALETELKIYQSPLNNRENREEERIQVNGHEQQLHEKNQSQNEQTDKIERSDEVRLEYNSVQGGKTLQRRPEQLPSKAHSEPQSYQLQSKSMFKSNKRVIEEICELLTYRMMAQRYTYNELKADIQKSVANTTNEFSYIDLCHMFVGEPFYLTVQYCRTLICFILEKERPSHNDAIGTMTLIAKLRRVIRDFDIIEPEQQKKMIQNSSNIITMHAKQIKQACEGLKNEDKSISHHHLKQVLQKLQLSQSEISMMIGELSICCQSLAHLNLDVLFQRFDLNELQNEEQQNNIIEQLQNDDSYINRSKQRQGEAKEQETKMNESSKQEGGNGLRNSKLFKSKQAIQISN